MCSYGNGMCRLHGKTDVERQRVNVERMQMLGAKVEAVTSGNMTLKMQLMRLYATGAVIRQIHTM